MSLVSDYNPLSCISALTPQLPPEDEGDDGIEVAWGTLIPLVPPVYEEPLLTAVVEDQQRINTFSKLNNRLSDIQDQLKEKRVRL